MRLLLQFPEGLKQYAMMHAKKLEQEGNEVFISASPTFGACDLSIDEAKNIHADKIVHFGHAEFHKADFNVEYIEYNIDAPLNMLDRALPLLNEYETLGLITTIQHVHQLPVIKEFFEKHGKKILIGKPYGFAKKPGQILGCDVGSAASIDRGVDAFIYFGGGMFHPLGALLNTTKPFLIVEPFAEKVEFIDSYRKTYKGRSKGKILKALDAKRFGILLTTKNGQHNEALAKLLKEKIEKAGLDAEILVSNTFDFISLGNMLEFEAFVNTACPRIAIDDSDRIGKPLLSANEVMEVLKIKAEQKAIRNQVMTP
jgi:2-(3-amino-3-carboxypropyl)histidine synthase